MERKSPLTTLCYIEKDGQYLMLHRVSKKRDVNKGKWIGVGGHFEAGESPEECLLREVREETGLTLTSWQFRGILTFGWRPAAEEQGGDPIPAPAQREAERPSDFEYICVYTADGFAGEMADCDEGELSWVPKSEIMRLNLWEGDRIFLRLLLEDAPFFSMKLCYVGDDLRYAALDGRELHPRKEDA